MCGIIAVIKKREDGIPTKSTILGMLATQAHRGVQGFGYLGFDDKVNSYVRREMRYEIEKAIDKNVSRSIVFHHRYPTSTPNLADCTHPIKVSHTELSADYYLVHNGVISNDSILREKHLELGYEYTTTVENKIITKNHCKSMFKWNDSEALAIDVARFLEKKQDKIESVGSIAFICVKVNKETEVVEKVFFGRNVSALTIKINKNTVVLRSEGETESTIPHMLYELDMKSFKVSKKECRIGDIASSRFSYEEGDYFRDFDHYNRQASYTSEETMDLRRKAGIDTTVEDEDIEDIEDMQRCHQIGELEVKIQTLTDEIFDLGDECKAYENINNSERYEFEISEIKREIEDKKTKMKLYCDELEILETGELQGEEFSAS